jgi:hypothetical protein
MPHTVSGTITSTGTLLPDGTAVSGSHSVNYTYSYILPNPSGVYSVDACSSGIANLPLYVQAIGDSIPLSPTDIKDGLICYHSLQETGIRIEDNSGNGYTAYAIGTIPVRGRTGYGRSLGQYPYGHINVPTLPTQSGNNYMCTFWFKPTTLLVSGSNTSFTIMGTHDFYGDHFINPWDYKISSPYQGWYLLNPCQICVASKGVQAGTTITNGPRTVVSRSYGPLINNRVIESFTIYSSSSALLSLKIMKNTSGNVFDIIDLESFTHNGGGSQTFVLTSPYYVPDDGATYYPGFYLPLNIGSNSSSASFNDRSAPNNLVGNGITLGTTINTIKLQVKYVDLDDSVLRIQGNSNTNWFSNTNTSATLYFPIDKSWDWDIETEFFIPTPAITDQAAGFIFFNSTSLNNYCSFVVVARGQYSFDIKAQTGNYSYTCASDIWYGNSSFKFGMKKVGQTVYFRYLDPISYSWIWPIYYMDCSLWSSSMRIGLQSYNPTGAAPVVTYNYIEFVRGVKPAGVGDPEVPGRIWISYNETSVSGTVGVRTDSRIWLHTNRDGFAAGTSTHTWDPSKWYLLQFGTKPNAAPGEYCWWVNGSQERGLTVGSGTGAVSFITSDGMNYFDPYPQPASGSFVLDEVAHWSRWLTGEESLKMVNKVSQVAWFYLQGYYKSDANVDMISSTTTSGDSSLSNISGGLRSITYAQYQQGTPSGVSVRFQKISYRIQIGLNVVSRKLDQATFNIIRRSSGWVGANTCYCEEPIPPWPLASGTLSANTANGGNVPANLKDGNAASYYENTGPPANAAYYLRVSYPLNWPTTRTGWKAIRFRAYSSVNFWLTDFPKTMRICGSNLMSPTTTTDSDWEYLFDITSPAPPSNNSWADWATFPWTVRYPHYRIQFLTNYGNSSTNWITISEMDINTVGLEPNALFFDIRGDVPIYNQGPSTTSNNVQNFYILKRWTEPLVIITPDSTAANFNQLVYHLTGPEYIDVLPARNTRMVDPAFAAYHPPRGHFTIKDYGFPIKSSKTRAWLYQYTEGAPYSAPPEITTWSGNITVISGAFPMTLCTLPANCEIKNISIAVISGSRGGYGDAQDNAINLGVDWSGSIETSINRLDTSLYNGRFISYVGSYSTSLTPRPIIWKMCREITATQFDLYNILSTTKAANHLQWDQLPNPYLISTSGVWRIGICAASISQGGPGSQAWASGDKGTGLGITGWSTYGGGGAFGVRYCPRYSIGADSSQTDFIKPFETAGSGSISLTHGHMYSTVSDLDRVLKLYSDAVVPDTSGQISVVIQYQLRSSPYLKEDNFCFDQFNFKTQPTITGSKYVTTSGKGWTVANPQNTTLAMINQGASVVVDLDYSNIVGSGYHQYITQASFAGALNVLEKSAYHYDPVAAVNGTKVFELATVSGVWQAPGGGSSLVPTPSGKYTAPFSYITIPSGLYSWTVETKFAAERLGDLRGQYVGLMLTYENDPSKFYQLVTSADGIINYCHQSPWDRVYVPRKGAVTDEIWMRVTKSGSVFTFNWSEDYETWNHIDPFILTSGTHPPMSDYNTPAPYRCWASSEYTNIAAGGGYAWQAFDGTCKYPYNPTSTDRWCSSVSAYDYQLPQWLAFDFAIPVFIYYYQLQNPSHVWGTQSDGFGATPASFELHGSNTAADNDWTVLDKRQDTAEYGECGWSLPLQIRTPGAYRYYRLYVTNVHPSQPSYCVALGQLSLIGTALPLPAYKTDSNYLIGPVVISERDQIYTSTSNALVPIMTSSGSPSPFVVTSSMPDSANAWKVFGTDFVYYDSSPSIPWTPPWIQIDMGSFVVVQGVRFIGHLKDTFYRAIPYDFRILGSTDNSQWTTVYTSKGARGYNASAGNAYVPSADMNLFLEFPNNTPYRYYRLYIDTPGAFWNTPRTIPNALWFSNLQFKGVTTNRQEVTSAYTHASFDYVKVTTTSGLESITIGDDWELMLDGKAAVNSGANTCVTALSVIDPSTYYFSYYPKTSFDPGASVFVRVKAEESPSFRLTYDKSKCFFYASVSGSQANLPFTSHLGEVTTSGGPALSYLWDESPYTISIYAMTTSGYAPPNYITTTTGIVYEGQYAISKTASGCYLETQKLDASLFNGDWTFHVWLNAQAQAYTSPPKLTYSQNNYLDNKNFAKAFDGNPSTICCLTWGQEPTTTIITPNSASASYGSLIADSPWQFDAVRFLPTQEASWWNGHYPRNVWLYYSDDDTTYTRAQAWVIPSAPSSMSQWGDWLIVNPPIGAHRFYRLYIGQPQGWVGYGNQAEFSECQVRSAGTAIIPPSTLFSIKNSDTTEALRCDFGMGGGMGVYQNNMLVGSSDVINYTGNNWAHFAVVKKGPWVNTFFNGIKLGGNITLSGTLCTTGSGYIDFFNNYTGYVDMIVMEKGARWISDFYTAEQFDEIFTFKPASPIDLDINFGIVPDTNAPIVIPITPLPMASGVCPASGIVFEILDDFSGVKWEQTYINIGDFTVWSGGNNMTEWCDDRGTLTYEDLGKAQGEWADIQLTESGVVYTEGINRQLYPPGTIYDDSGAWGRRFTYYAPNDTQILYFGKTVAVVISGTDSVGYGSQFDALQPNRFANSYSFEFIPNDNIEFGNVFLNKGESKRIDELNARGEHFWVDLLDSDYPETDIAESECSLTWSDGFSEFVCSGTWFTTWTGNEWTGSSGIVMHRMHWDPNNDWNWKGNRAIQLTVEAHNNNPTCSVYNVNDYIIYYGWQTSWFHQAIKDLYPAWDFNHKLPIFVSIKTDLFAPGLLNKSYMFWTSPGYKADFYVTLTPKPIPKDDLKIGILAYSQFLQYSEDVEIEVSCKDLDGNEMVYVWKFRTQDKPN